MSLKTVFVIIVGLAVLYLMFTAGLPFMLALLVALFLEPLVQLMMRKLKMNRVVAAVTASTLFTLVVVGLFFLIMVKIYSEVMAFLRNLPKFVEQANLIVQDLLEKTQTAFDELPADVVVTIQNAADAGVDTLINALSSLSRSMFNLAAVVPNMFILFIIFIVALYLMTIGLNSMKQSFLSFFEESSRTKVSDVLDNLRGSIFGFIRAQAILSGLTYLVAFLGLVILRVDYASVIALLIMIVDILPVLGTGSVLVPWAIICLAMGNYLLAVGLFVLFLFITAFRKMIEPKIIGNSIGLSPLSTLISLWIGFELVGVIGVFLGPIVLIIYQAMRRVGLLRIHIRLEDV
jgi:sporulation integral membrane protein YtvI